MGALITPLFDTARDQQVSISLDIGVIPVGFPNPGKFIITFQAHPLPDRKAAQVLCNALREAIESKLGVKMGDANG